MNVLVGPLLFLLLFAGVELIRRKGAIRAEYTRKVAHVGSGVLASLAPYILTAGEIVGSALVFTGLLALARRYRLLSWVQEAERTTHGEIYFPLGVGATALLFLPHDIVAFQFGVLVLALADAAAAMVGEGYGAHRLPVWGGGKTLEGTVAFFLVSVATFLAVVFFRDEIPLYGGVIAAGGATVLELLLARGLDNLLLPVVAAYLVRAFEATG